MDEKKVDEKKLEGVTGGWISPNFISKFADKNCHHCAKEKAGMCPYGDLEARYHAFGHNADAVCPERT